MWTLTILIVFLHFSCSHLFTLGHELELAKKEPLVFLEDSIELSSRHLCSLTRECAGKCEHVAQVISDVRCHFIFATECTARILKFAAIGLILKEFVFTIECRDDIKRTETSKGCCTVEQ